MTNNSNYEIRMPLKDDQVKDLLEFWREHGERINAGQPLHWSSSDHLRLILLPEAEAIHMLKSIALDVQRSDSE